jgi:putative ABC transport system ATP-binding protein
MLVRFDKVRCRRALSRESPSMVDIDSFRQSCGGVTFVAGPVGSGKNLFLRLAGLLEQPDEGAVYFAGEPVHGMTDEERANTRAHHCGYVFHEPFLLPGLTVAENVAMPLLKTGMMEAEAAAERTVASLAIVGIQGSSKREVTDLTETEQLRVALARAIALHPKLLMVETPDDLLSGPDLSDFLRAIRSASLETGITAMVSLDDDRFASLSNRTVILEAGRIIRDESARIAE